MVDLKKLKKEITKLEKTGRYDFSNAMNIIYNKYSDVKKAYSLGEFRSAIGRIPSKNVSDKKEGRIFSKKQIQRMVGESLSLIKMRRDKLNEDQDDD